MWSGRGFRRNKNMRPMLNSYELCDGVHEVQAIIFTLHCIVVHRWNFPNEKMKKLGLRPSFKENHRNIEKSWSSTNTERRFSTKCSSPAGRPILRGVNLGLFSKAGTIITGAGRGGGRESETFERRQEAGFYQLFIYSIQRSLWKNESLLRKNRQHTAK